MSLSVLRIYTPKIPKAHIPLEVDTIKIHPELHVNMTKVFQNASLKMKEWVDNLILQEQLKITLDKPEKSSLTTKVMNVVSKAQLQSLNFLEWVKVKFAT